MARNSGVPSWSFGVMLIFRVDMSLTLNSPSWCWGLRLGAVELFPFSRFRCLTFFWASAFRNLLEPWRLFRTRNFIVNRGVSWHFQLFWTFYFCTKDICSKKPATFYECVTHPLVDFLQMGGCVTPRLCSQRFFAGSLGPQTVVGSASFNLFCDPPQGRWFMGWDFSSTQEGFRIYPWNKDSRHY